MNELLIIIPVTIMTVVFVVGVKLDSGYPGDEAV